MRFSTLADAATVTVEQPANPAFPTQTLNIPANGTQTLDLTPWLDDIENKPLNTVLLQGIHITSDNPVTAYYEVNHNLNPDIFALKGPLLWAMNSMCLSELPRQRLYPIQSRL